MGVCYSIGENMSYFLFVISVLTLSKLTLSLDNGVARTPPSIYNMYVVEFPVMCCHVSGMACMGKVCLQY